MRFSIIIVCYRADVGALLDCVRDQRLLGDEVIVVDNAAASGGTAGVRGHPAVDRVVEPDENLGFSAAANLAAAAAEGDVILLVNPDAVLAAGCLDALRDPPCAWSAWMGVVTLADGETINTAGGVSHFLGFSWAGRLGELAAALPEAPHPTGFLSGACMAVRRDVWRELGGLPEHFFLYCEDVDMSHRLRLAGHAFGVLPAARIAHDYVFDKGAYKWRLLERNRWATIVRTYPGPLLWLVLPLLLACELPLLAVAVAGGWAPAKLRAWLDVLAWMPRARSERSAIQAAARVSPRTFADGLTAQLQSAHFGAVGRSRWLSVALRAYWGVVLRVLARRS